MPGLIWRGLYLDDNRVFYGQEDVYTPNFTVDIMLDASASRGEYQRVIAAQAYVIAEAPARLRHSLPNLFLLYPPRLYSHDALPKL